MPASSSALLAAPSASASSFTALSLRQLPQRDTAIVPAAQLRQPLRPAADGHAAPPSSRSPLVVPDLRRYDDSNQGQIDARGIPQPARCCRSMQTHTTARRHEMQFGIFSVSDITRDPVTGYTPSEAERIDAIVKIAQKTEEIGMDVFAIGEHHNPPFFSSSPTTLLAYIAATTKRLIVTTSTTLITTNDPVRIAEEYAMLQHLSKGRMDLMLGRGNTAPVYPWFGQDIRQGLPLALENYNLLHRLWREDVVDCQRQVPHPAAGLHLHPASARRRAAVRLARLDPLPGDRRTGRLLRRRLLRQQHLLAEGALHPADQVLPAALRPLRPRHGEAGDRRPRRPGVPREELPGRQERVPARTSTRRRSTATARRWRTSWR